VLTSPTCEKACEKLPTKRRRSRVLGRQETHEGHCQQAGIDVLRSIILLERPQFRVKSVPANLVMEFGPDLPPALDRPVHPEMLHSLDGPVEGDPAHHLGVGKVPPRSVQRLAQQGVKTIALIEAAQRPHRIPAPRNFIDETGNLR
jgi:hypothetical protein